MDGAFHEHHRLNQPTWHRDGAFTSTITPTRQPGIGMRLSTSTITPTSYSEEQESAWSLLPVHQAPLMQQQHSLVGAPDMGKHVQGKPKPLL